PVRAGAPVDDDRHVRVLLIVRRHLLEEVLFELTRNHAIDHCQPTLTVSLYGWVVRSLVPGFKFWDHADPGLETGIPDGEPGLELLVLSAAVGQAHTHGRVPADPILVPGEVPDERQDDVRGRPGESDDAHLRRAQAAGESLHTPRARTRQ